MIMLVRAYYVVCFCLWTENIMKHGQIRQKYTVTCIFNIVLESDFGEFDFSLNEPFPEF